MDAKTGGMIDTFILELSSFFKLLSYYAPSEKMKTNADFINWMRYTPNLSEQYISELMYILPQPRQSFYQDQFSEMRKVITSKLLMLEEQLGYYPIQVTSGILDKLHTLEMGILVVSMIFSITKVVFSVIAILIIYSLLMVSIESKNFEMAVIRMVGFRQSGIIMLIMVQSFFYVLPALFCSMATCYIAMS